MIRLAIGASGTDLGPDATLLDYLLSVDLLGLDLWQLLAAIGVVVLGLAIQGLLFDRLVAPLREAFASTETKLDGLFLKKTRRPFNWLVRLLALYLGLVILDLPDAADRAVDLAAITFGTLLVAWLLFCAIDVLIHALETYTDETDSEIDDQLVPIVRRILRFALVSIAILAVIQQWGYNVGSLLAGLGIGGLAFALAARNMLSNWFGALMIFTDRPFQIGEWVETDFGTGAIEEVGLRSTRIRTYDRKQVVVPNSEMTSTAVTNLTARDRRQIHAELGLVYDTTHDQLTSILEEIRTLLDEHDEVWDDDWRVFFVEYGDSALVIELSCFTEDPDLTDYRQLREELFLEIMRIVEENGSDFAFPTRAIHMEDGAESSDAHPGSRAGAPNG
jgi:MscS family membrane protein